MDKIRIIEAGNELDLGGTEYVIQLYSKYLNKEYFEVTVVGIYNGGARVKLIQDLGISVLLLNGDLEYLAALLKSTDVFHWHGNGRVNTPVFKVIQENKPRMVIQTNVFGKYDHSAFYNLIDYDLYISNMILIRRMHEDSLYPIAIAPNLYASKRKVLPYPVDVEHIVSLLPRAADLKTFKRRHNLEGKFIVGRIGRADNSKFDLIALAGFAAFAEKVSHARFILVGATPEMIASATAIGISHQLIVLETTNDLKQLMLYYKSFDVFLAASNIGESFGMVIAEAMTAEVPVITISTEDRDNAQIELVDNDITGLVVERNTTKIADSIAHLYENENVRTRLSANSRNKIIREYKAEKIVGSLEALIFNHLKLDIPTTTQSLVKDYSFEMVSDYNERTKNLWSKA